MYTYTNFVPNVHNSAVMDREGGGGGLFTGLVVLFSLISSFLHIQKGVIIGLKSNTRNMSCVTMLKHIMFYTKGLVIIYKKCLKRLILPLLI